MDENLHDIDKLFRDSIEEHAEMPPAKVWDAIDSNLDKNSIVITRRKYNNLKRVVAALVFLLLATVAYEIYTSKLSGGNSAGNKKDVEDKLVDNTEKQNSVTNNTTSSTPNTNNSEKSNKTDKVNTVDGNEQVVEKTDRPKDINPSNKNTAPFLNNTNPPALSNNNFTGNDNEPIENNKQQRKKSFTRKTTAVITNGTAYLPEEENNTAVATNDKDNIVAADNALAPLAKTLAVKINGGHAGLLNRKAPRISPDAVVKNNFVKERKPASAKAFHFSIMPFFSPQFTFARIEEDHHQPRYPQQSSGQEIKNNEQHQHSLSFGALLTIPVSKKIGVQTGVTYLSKKTEMEPKKIFAKLDNDGKVKYRFDCSSGYAYISPKAGTAPSVGDSINAAASSNTLQYIGIPLAVTYNFSAGKFAIVPTIGTTVNILVKHKIKTELEQGSIKESHTTNDIQGLKSTYFTAVAGVSFEYNLSKRISLSLMPAANIALSSITKDATVKSYPNSLGLSGGVKIKF